MRYYTRAAVRAGRGQAMLPARRTSFSCRLLLTRRLRLSFFFATFSSVAVITTPLPLNIRLSDQCRKHC